MWPLWRHQYCLKMKPEKKLQEPWLLQLQVCQEQRCVEAVGLDQHSSSSCACHSPCQHPWSQKAECKPKSALEETPVVEHAQQQPETQCQ